MQVELHCPHCLCSFAASPDAPATEVLDRMAEEGPWYALGDGETFEDMIFSTLFASGSIRCSECGESVSVNEESLDQLTLEVSGSYYRRKETPLKQRWHSLLFCVPRLFQPCLASL